MTKISDQIKAKNSVRNDAHISHLTHSHDNRQRYTRAPRRPAAFIDDGGDHINVWSYGQTDLGKALAFDTDIWIDLPGLGVFRSVFALWTFLTTKKRTSSLRKANSKVLRALVSTRLNDDNYEDYPNVRYICGVAILDHILRNKALATALIASADAPLTSYIEKFDGSQYEHPQAQWWIPTLRLIRATLLTGDRISNKTLHVLKDTQHTDEQIFVALPEYTPPRLGVVNFDTQVKDPQLAKPVGSVKPKVAKEKREPSEKQKELQDSLKLDPNHQIAFINFPTKEDRSNFMAYLLQLKLKGEVIQLTGYILNPPASRMQDATYPLYITIESHDSESKVIDIVSMATAIFHDPFAVKPVETIKSEHGVELVRNLVNYLGVTAAELMILPQFDQVKDKLINVLYPMIVFDPAAENSDCLIET